METVHVAVDPAFEVSPVSRHLFGSFVEHLGRGVYTGIFEPSHESADADGMRTDVLALVKELGVTVIRYPGGNFVSGYRWEDGIGPVENRPTRLDLAWHSTEPNTFGLDEYMRWAASAQVDTVMAVNLGTRDVPEALDILEYCNIASGTTLSDARRVNGANSPYGITLWCLGNEMDGPWQIGARSAREYGRMASRAAKAMRMLDPRVQLVVCGSSGSHMPTFGTWERTVLEETYDDVDYISAHAYYAETDGDLGSFLASAVDMDYFIDSVVATSDEVGVTKKSAKKIMISFDEWNVWYQDRAPSAPPSGDNWPIAPALLEDRYTVADAVVVGSLLISLLRHSDRVRLACLAQLVNAIAPIVTEPGGRAWRQTIFHPFALTARYARGVVLQAPVLGPGYTTDKYGDVALVDAVATHDSDNREVAVFLVNRSQDGPTRVELELGAELRGARIVEALHYSSPDPYWVATADDPDGVLPRPFAPAVTDTMLSVELPPVCWAMIRISYR